MLTSRIGKKFTAIVLIFGLLMSVLPMSFAPQANAATSDLEVTYGLGARIGNLTYAPTNSFINFYNSQVPGFKQTLKSSNAAYDWSKGDIFAGKGDHGTTVRFEINVADNPTLRDLAQSGHADMLIGFSILRYHSGLFWNRRSTINITMDGKSLMSYRTGSSNVYNKSAKATITPTSVIKIEVYGEGNDKGGGEECGVRGLYFKFQDLKRPVLSNYTFTGNGAERYNETINQTELYVKKDENVTLSYNFSEPVRPYALNAAYYQQLTQQPLFVNPAGTGLPTAGQPQYLKNITYPDFPSMSRLQQKISYQYVGALYHESGNLPLEPKITGTTTDGTLPMDKTLEEKFKESVLADAAGNVATINFPNVADASSNAVVKNRAINPFDYNAGGYRVIVDAVRPKYTKVGNGIQPEILTGVTLNYGDVIDFTVQMTEEAIVKKGWDVKKTFLYFNNGMKAYYTGGSNTKNWTFRATVTDGVDLETPLLKVIALSNDAKGDESDIGVIQDYAGNLLIQPANYDGTFSEFPDGNDSSIVNSKIDWANLSIDNTPPLIGYRYEVGGASDQTYQKYGRVTIDANDPAIKVPSLDPETVDRGKDRPSKGIYRPSNMSGNNSPSVGLVYYMWSRDKENPFKDKAEDNFAAVKRYSLTGKQPSEDLYPGEFEDIQLQVTNNKTNLLSPPPETKDPENSGEWYLHTWTADMTWDSARELKQYQKMKEFVANNPEQYAAWKAEAPGSEADKIFYADNKALAAVGNYGDTLLWELDEFKESDSNWTYNVGVLKLDNQIPEIKKDSIIGDYTDNVTVTTQVRDEHSGIDQVYYQWVKDGEKPADVMWKTGNYESTILTQSTNEDVFEDGAYWLYIKAVDKAGNETVETPLTEAVTVDSQHIMPVKFTPESNADYVQSHDVTFQISGITPDFVGYVLSSSASHPTDNAEFKELQGTVSVSEDGIDTGLSADQNLIIDEDTKEKSNEDNKESKGTEEKSESESTNSLPNDDLKATNNPAATYSYVITADSSLNGVQYVHMIVKQGDKAYYYTKAYYFDNEPPKVSFSKNGVPYPLESQEVKVTLTEYYSKTGLVAKYQWVKEGDQAPTASSEGWIDLADSGRATIDGGNLKPGEVADYKLYVWAVDGAGNSSITSTPDIFKVSAAPDKNTPPAAAQSDLIYLYGDDEDGYTAIVKLDLQTEDKSGYEYSISPDNGESWLKWKPYTNFVSTKVPVGTPDKLQLAVKFKTPGGKIGEPVKLDTKGVSLGDAPVYALASLNKTSPVTSAVGVDIDISLPLGIKVMPSKVNPSELVRTGSKFHVKENGVYSFDLTDLNNAVRKDTLYVVVKNVDDIPPQGTVEYSISEYTNRDVTAFLSDTSEPVTITNNKGKNSYTFKENGSFTFEFKDAAGNVGHAEASVYYIDKAPPRVKIVRSYQYGKNGDKTFGTILDNNGNVVASSGVTLEVQKGDASAKDFFIVSQNSTITMFENGTASFIVEDKYGNSAIVKEVVNNIVAEAPQADSIDYTFVDSSDQPIDNSKIVTIDGKKYAKGKVKATISGQTILANPVFSGVKPIEVDGSYTNKISDADGKFTYSRTFESNGSVVMAIADLLGNANRVPVVIAGLDNTVPELKLNQSTVGIVQNKLNFDFQKDLGGYTVSDNVSKAENIKVSISGLDMTKLGRQLVTYMAVDEVGNISTAYQDVVVVKDKGLLIFGNDVLISASSGETALFDRNTITFKVSGYDTMNVNGQDKINEWGTFDIYYQPGLYREGQLKAIAQKVSYQQLINGQFKVTFPQVGWYTIIVRTQERDREYATFFVGNVK